MAYKTQYQGTSVNDFLDTSWYDINGMTKKELWDFSRQAVQAANRRVSRMEKALGDVSPGVQRFLDAGGGKVSMKMSPGQMKATIVNLRNFLEPPDPGTLTTKTLSGYKKYLKTIGNIIGETRFQTNEGFTSYADLPEESRRSLWNFIDSARSETGYGRTKEMGSDAFIKNMTEYWVGNGQFNFDRGQEVTTVISEEELQTRRGQIARAFAESLGVMEDFNSFGGR